MTALVIPVLAIVLGVALTVTAIGGGALARQRVLNAADLAALAGVTGGCRAADAVARAHDAVLLACEHDGSDVIVRVEVAAPAVLTSLLGGQAPSVSGVARAGLPASPDSGA